MASDQLASRESLLRLNPLDSRSEEEVNDILAKCSSTPNKSPHFAVTIFTKKSHDLMDLDELDLMSTLNKENMIMLPSLDAKSSHEQLKKDAFWKKFLLENQKMVSTIFAVVDYKRIFSYMNDMISLVKLFVPQASILVLIVLKTDNCFIFVFDLHKVNTLDQSTQQFVAGDIEPAKKVDSTGFLLQHFLTSLEKQVPDKALDLYINHSCLLQAYLPEVVWSKLLYLIEDKHHKILWHLHDDNSKNRRRTLRETKLFAPAGIDIDKHPRPNLTALHVFGKIGTHPNKTADTIEQLTWVATEKYRKFPVFPRGYFPKLQSLSIHMLEFPLTLKMKLFPLVSVLRLKCLPSAKISVVFDSKHPRLFRYVHLTYFDGNTQNSSFVQIVKLKLENCFEVTSVDKLKKRALRIVEEEPMVKSKGRGAANRLDDESCCISCCC